MRRAGATTSIYRQLIARLLCSCVRADVYRGWPSAALRHPKKGPGPSGNKAAPLRLRPPTNILDSEHQSLNKLLGGLWHAYRRKWATERKDLPLKDVAAAGGWKDVTTLLTCYQHADEATMLKVMESPVKLVSRRAGSAVVETVAETIAVGEK